MPNRSTLRRRQATAARLSARAGRLSLASVITLAVAHGAYAPAAWAGLEGGAVSAGQAQVSKSGNLTSIRQQSNRAVIDWRSFDIGANEAVTFIQPDARSATLNRVIGTNGSTILGRITANGSVYIVNPNGVLFGAGAQVNVGGLVASTANVGNASFMAGSDRFDQPGSAGAKVENRGTIRIADRGILALVGRQVSNSGFIVAALGKVALAGGDAFVLDLAGDRLVSLILDPAALEQVRDAQGNPLSARVDNTGNIQANGGRIEFSADTVSRLLDNIIHVQGDVRAVSVDAAGGVISLRGGATTDVTLGGVLQPGGRVGRIDVSGRDIIVQPTAQIDLGQGADLDLAASRNLEIRAPLNALRSGSVAGAGLTASAGQDLTVTQNIVLNDGALSLTARDGRLVAAAGTVLQSGNQAATLRGGSAVSVDQVLTSGAVDIASAAGAVEVGSAIVAPTSAADAAPVARLSLTAARGVTLAGALASGEIAVRSGADLTLRGASIESRSGNVSLHAGGRARSADAALGVVAGVGNAVIVTGGDLDLHAVIAGGDITLSSGGALAIAQTLGGMGPAASRSVVVDGGGQVSLAAGAHAGTVRITSRNGDVVAGDLVASGGVSVVASGGRAGTAAAPLRVSAGDGAGTAGVAGGVSVEGRDGVAIATLVTPGAVLLRSGSGGVSVASAITGSTASDLADAAPARTVRIEAAGEVNLSGVRAGAGGITVTGASAGLGAGMFTLSDQPRTVGGLSLAGGSLLSDGAVSVTSVGALRADALVQSGATVSLTSTAGPLTIGVAGVRTTTAGRGISLFAAGDLQLNGDLQAQAATIAVTTTGGAVTAVVGTAGADPVGSDATIGAGSDAQASNVTIAAAGDVTLGGIRAAGSVVVNSVNGNVRLLSPLGGTNTGYAAHANGYQTALRPDVGTLTVSAPRGSIELNGLNLDGLADPQASGTGLKVEAGRMVLSNGIVAVNKGDILLQGGTTQASDGVYLGNSVFSRGWDSVGSDGVRGGTGTAADEKRGFGIRIAGRNLGVFDNTTAVADLPGLFTVALADGSKVLTDSQAYLVDSNGTRLLDASGGLRRAVSATSAVDGVFAITCGGPSTCVNDVRVVTGVDATSGASNDSAVLGLATSRTVAKIEIANNVANFRDIDPATQQLSSRLVPASNTPSGVVVDTSFVGGVTNSVVRGDAVSDGRQSLVTFTPVMGGLSQAPVRVTPAADGSPKQASTFGMVVKLLGFESAGDTPTEIWNQRVAFGLNESAPLARPTDPAQKLQGTAFPSDSGLGKTFGQGLNSDGEGISAGPVGGAFSLTVRGAVTYKFAESETVFNCTECSASYQIQRLPGSLSGFGVVQASGLSFDAMPNQVFSPVMLNGLAVGTYLQVRFDGAPVIASPGRGAGAEIRGTLLRGASATYGGPLAGPVGQSPSDPAQVQLPPWSQGPDGTLTPRVFNLYTPPLGYLLGRVVVDSSTVAAAYPADERGTRILIFDGILDTQLGRVSGDSTGGVNYIPGFGGIPGKNNSTTGFTSVGAAVGNSAGRSGATATSAASARPVPGTTGARAGAGVNVAPTAAADPGFVPRVDVADRSAQDALTAADANPKARQATPADDQPSELIEIGVGPAAQADLGRNGSLGGAAHNVFKRSYQVAASTDSVVCAPGTIAQTDAAPPRSPTVEGTAPATPTALARDCKPPRR